MSDPEGLLDQTRMMLNSHHFWGDTEQFQRAGAAMIDFARRTPPTPIGMLLYCPKCGEQHVDAASEDWDNPPHRSHLCHQCGCIWRPADVPTVGVASIETRGLADTWTSASAASVSDWHLPAKRMPPLHNQVLIELREGVGAVHDVACYLGKHPVEGGGTEDRWLCADVRLDTRQIKRWAFIRPAEAA